MVARKHMVPMIIIRNEFEDGKCINHFETGFGPPGIKSIPHELRHSRPGAARSSRSRP